MVEISKELREALEATYNPLYCPTIPYRVIYMGTCNAVGKPNISIMSFANVIDKDKIAIPDVAMLKTRQNLKENDKVSLTCVLYRSFEPVGGKWVRFLNWLCKHLGKLEFNKWKLLRIRFLLWLYKRLPLLPKVKLVVRPLPRQQIKCWQIFGRAEVRRWGKEFDLMQDFGKRVFGDVFKLYGMVIIHVEKIKELSWYG